MNLQNLGIIDWHKVLIFCARGEPSYNLHVSSHDAFLAAWEIHNA